MNKHPLPSIAKKIKIIIIIKKNKKLHAPINRKFGKPIEQLGTSS